MYAQTFRLSKISRAAAPLGRDLLSWRKRFYSSGPVPGLADPVAYCKELVRKHDYESFLLAPFYPKDAQAGYYAIKAFAVELAMVQDNVSNATIGTMRMQFWRDALQGCAQGKPPQHPIALALHEAMQRVHLPVYHFKRIIDAREAELHVPTHLTIESLTAHAESTSSTVLYLLLSLLSLSSTTLSHAASHLGIAQTITTLIRALPFHAAQGRMVVPAEITAKHGVSQEAVFRHGGEAEGMGEAVYAFATLGNDHLTTAREAFRSEGQEGSRALGVFLAGVPVSNVLARLEKANFNAFGGELENREWRLAWLVWRGYHRGAF